MTARFRPSKGSALDRQRSRARGDGRARLHRDRAGTASDRWPVVSGRRAGRVQNGRVLVGYGGAMIRFPAVTVQSSNARDMFGYMVGR